MDINNLNFKVLLGDDEFRNAIERDKTLAKAFNAELSQILDFKRKMGKGIKLVDSSSASDVDKTAKKMKDVKDETKGAENAAKGLSSEYRRQSGLLRDLGTIASAYFSIRGVERFLSSLVRVTGEFEVQKVALSSMLGDAGKADEIFSTLRQNALESPYTFQDLTKYAKQLIAFNIDADKLIDTEKMLADVAAGLGVDVGRIILAYGQVKAAGVLKGTELRQFTEAGVPLLQSLADQIEAVEGKTIALSEVFSRISKKEIPFEMVEKAFRDMTSEGGKFYNMQAVLVETLQGKIGKLKDVWQQTIYDIGNADNKVLKGVVDIITEMVSHISVLVNSLAPLVAGIGAYAAVSAVAWSLEKVKIVGQFVKYIVSLAKGLKAAAAAQTAFTASQAMATGVLATTTGAIAATVAVVAALGVGIYEVAKAFKEEDKYASAVTKSLQDYQVEVRNELRGAEKLIDRMSRLSKNTEEYKTAKDQLLSQYGQYLSETDKEKIAVGNLAGVYESLRISITEAAKARFKAAGMKSLHASFAEESTSVFGKVNKIVNGVAGRRAGVTADNAAAIEDELIKYVTNEYGVLDLSPVAQDVLDISGHTELVNNISALKKKYGEAADRVKKEEERLDKIFGETPPPPTIKKTTDDDDWDPDWNKKNDAAKELENQIRLLQQFRDAYNRLIGAGKTDTEARSLLASLFPAHKELTEIKDYDAEIGNLMKQLEGVDKEAYGAMMLSEGMKKLSEALKEIKKEEKAVDVVDKLTQTEIDKFASRAFKNATSKMSLKRYGNKTIFGINDILKELNELEFSEDMLDEDARKKIKEGAASLDDFRDVFNKMKKEKTAEASNALAKQLKTLATGIAELGSSLAKYGDAAGNDFLAGLGETITGISQLASTVAQGFSQGGWIGGVVAGVISIGKAILEDMTYAEELKARIAEVRTAKWQSDMDESLGSSDGLFGTNYFQKLNSAMDVAAKAYEKLQKLRIKTTVKTINRGGLNELISGDKVESLSKIVSKLGYDLYDEYGIINSEALQAILDTYDKLGTEDKRWMKEAITYAEEYKEALASMEEVTEEIVGDIASSAADKIVDSWAEAGDAALDYADILDDVARRYAKMIVQSTLIDSVFDEDFKERLNALVTGHKTEEAMQLVQESLDKIVEMAPEIAKILEPFRQYFQSESSDSSSVSGGIKSITEDTANLLAAYINAIRADVAMGNAQRGEILSILKEYVGLGSAPSYTEYLVQIEAHTANLSANTNSILSELRSIITPESGLPAVRVQTA